MSEEEKVLKPSKNESLADSSQQVATYHVLYNALLSFILRSSKIDDGYRGP